MLYKCPEKSFVKMIVNFFSFFHFVFMLFDIHTPTELMNVTLDSPVIYHFQCFFYFLPWIFGTTSSLFDGCIFFFINILSFCFLFHAKISIQKKKFVPYWELYLIRFYQTTFIQIFCYPLFFRLAYLIEHLGTQSDAISWISFLLCFINIICYFIHGFLASIFLSFVAFVPKSIFDTYDGKTNNFLFIVRFVMCMFCHLIGLLNNVILISLFAIILFVLSALIFYYRIVLTVHSNYLPQYLELAPIFSVPIIIFIHQFRQQLWLLLLSEMAVHIVILVSIFICHRLILRESLRLFGTFLKVGDSESAIPIIIPGNFVSVMRLIAINYGNPLFFEKILALNNPILIKASSVIEIVRFLGIFPSKRHAMIEKLGEVKSSSIYNRFIIYYYLKSLTSLTTTNIPYRYLEDLNMLQRTFLVHHHLYWQARLVKKPFLSFAETCSTSYYFCECRYELAYMMRRFPFCSDLYSWYADFSLIGLGSYSEYNRLTQVSENLGKDRNLLTDPILHRMVKINPRVLGFCSNEEILVSMPASNSVSSTASSHAPIASCLNVSRRMIPFIPCMHIFIASILFLLYFIFSISLETFTKDQYQTIHNEMPDLNDKYDLVTSSMFYPFALESANIDYTATNTGECQQYYDYIYEHIISFFMIVQQIESLSSQVFYFHEMQAIQAIKNNLSICDVLHSVTNELASQFQIESQHLHESLDQVSTQITSLYDDVSTEYGNRQFYKINIIASCFMIVLYVIVFIIQVNTTYRKNTEAIQYLASKERISALLLQNCIESWDLLYDYIPSHKLMMIHINREGRKSNKPFRIPFAKYTLSTSSSAVNKSRQNTEDSTISGTTDNTPESTSLGNTTTTTTTTSNNNTANSTTHNEMNTNVFLDDDKHLKLNSSHVSVSFTGVATQLFANRPSADEYMARLNKTTKSAPQSDTEQASFSKGDNEYISSSNENSHKKSPSHTKTSDKSSLEDSDASYDNEECIETTINITQKQTRFSWIFIPVIILLPWVFVIVISAILLLPMHFRLDIEREQTSSIVTSGRQLNATFLLIETTYDLLYNQSLYDPDVYYNIHEILIDGNTNITELFALRQCFQLLGITCTSISDLVFRFVSSLPGNYELLYVYLPAFVDFGTNVIYNVFLGDVDPVLEVPTSSLIGFFADYGVICLILYFYSFSLMFTIWTSINSLYHFPEMFLFESNKRSKSKQKAVENKEEEKEEEKEKKKHKKKKAEYYSKHKNKNGNNFPSVILTVASVVESDEIYSISENAASILNQPAPSFIGEKFSDTFSLVGKNNTEQPVATSSLDKNLEVVQSTSNFDDLNVDQTELREHLMPDRIKRKTFRSSTKQKGEFSITLMIEDDMQKVTKPAYMQESISEKLMNYVPTYFAKQFSDNNMAAFDFVSPLLIFLRYDSTKAQNELERFYTIINTCIMNYTSFKILIADGSLFVFSSVKKINPIIASLFVRDLITEGFSIARVMPTKAPISIYVEQLNSLKAVINTESEPYLEVELPDFVCYTNLLFELGDKKVAFDESFYSPLLSLDGNLQSEVVSFNDFSRTLRKMDFNQYISLLKKHL